MTFKSLLSTSLFLGFASLTAPAFAQLPVVAPPVAQLPVVPSIRICTGSPAGAYHGVVFTALKGGLRGVMDAKEVLGTPGTEGSGDNLVKLTRGDCDAAVVQSDAMTVYRAKHPDVSLDYDIAADRLYLEALHLVCRKEADLSKITKLSKGQKVDVGSAAGGSAVTWDMLVQADKGTYGSIGVDSLSGVQAAKAVSQGDNNTVCLLSVIAPAAPSILAINEAARAYGNLTLVGTADSDLLKLKDAKGRPLYTKVSVKRETYPSLQSGSVDVAAVATQLVVNRAWIEKAGTGYDDFLTVLNRVTPSIRTATGQ